MVVSDKVLPYNYKYHKRMSVCQLEYVVFVLVEKYREQNHNDMLPSWWPTSVEFSHPMVRNGNETHISNWKGNLLDVIESYYKSSGGSNSRWLYDLLQKTLTDNDMKFVHSIRDTTIENQKSKLNKVVENKTNNDIVNLKRQHFEKEKTEFKVSIKESALVKLLPKPVVLLCDVVKFGLDPNKENFLRKLDLMKTNQMLNTVRYKFRRRDSNGSGNSYHDEKNKNIPQNGFVTKPKISTMKKLPVITPCYVRMFPELKNTEMEANELSTTAEISNTSLTSTEIQDISFINQIKPSTTNHETEKEKVLVKKSSTLSLPNLKTGVRNSEPPFLILKSLPTIKKNLQGNNDSNSLKKNAELELKTINSETKKSSHIAKFASKKQFPKTPTLDFLSTKFFRKNNNKKHNSRKVPLKKSKLKRGIIKVKWMKPALKLKFSM